jgi:hypothetical protein
MKKENQKDESLKSHSKQMEVFSAIYSVGKGTKKDACMYINLVLGSNS